MVPLCRPVGYCGLGFFFTFEEKGLQPKLQADELAVALPRIAVKGKNLQFGQGLQQHPVQLLQPVVVQREPSEVVHAVRQGGWEPANAVVGQIEIIEASDRPEKMPVNILDGVVGQVENQQASETLEGISGDGGDGVVGQVEHTEQRCLPEGHGAQNTDAIVLQI